MKKIVILNIVISLIFINFIYCQPKTKLQYEYKKIESNKNSLNIQISYPVFYPSNLKLQKLLNQKLYYISDFTSNTNKTYRHNTYKEFLNLLNRLRSEKKIHGVNYYADAKVFFLKNNIVSIEISTYQMPYGAANGQNTIQTINYDLGTNKEIKLNQCINKSDFKKLKEIIPQYFELYNVYFNNNSQSFYFPDCWYFTKQGMTFKYQQYEIGSRADGIPVFTIPYNVLKGYLNKTIVNKIL